MLLIVALYRCLGSQMIASIISQSLPCPHFLLHSQKVVCFRLIRWPWQWKGYPVCQCC